MHRLAYLKPNMHAPGMRFGGCWASQKARAFFGVDHIRFVNFDLVSEPQGRVPIFFCDLAGRALTALQLNMPDFEDALQASAAMACGANYIIARNVRDFKTSPVPALTPEAFQALETSKKTR